MIPADFDWKSPNYTPVFARRAAALERIREASPADIDLLKAYYREHVADFIEDFGMTYDPRNVEVGLPPIMPFLLFPKQREFIDWVIKHWREQTPGMAEKSRDGGLSWLVVAIGCALCVLYEGMGVGYGSRKEEYVDKVDSPKSLFWKARFFMRHLPYEFRGGWREQVDAPHMRMKFPATGSNMTGEAGDDIGRGDRQGIYFVDEAQPLGAKILTPTGWSTMADMSIGSQVIGQDGLSHRVIHINECGVHEVFRLTFSDGTTADASPNHLWTVDKVIGKRERLTLRTSDLAEHFAYHAPGGQTLYRYRVPFCRPVEFANPSALLLHPYVLGVLLGDGAMTSGVVRMTSADAEVVEEVRRLLPTDMMIGAFDGRYSYNIVDRRGRMGRSVGGEYPRSAARQMMADLALKGCRSPEKFIPEIYKTAIPADRLSLLQGLMDSDGYATGGRASFHTSSRRLAEDVRFLVQSLGGTTYWNVKPDSRGYKDQYCLQIVMPETMCPFRLSRKRKEMRPRKAGGRTIVAIAPIGRMPVRCITVDAADGLYLTDNCIVTHNSAHLARPMLVEASLSQTTNCRIDVSSVNGPNNVFAQKRHSGKVDVWVWDWRDDPRKDEAWYAKQVAELDPIVVAQEIDRDYGASVEGIVIPLKWVQACFDALEKLGLVASGEIGVGYDVADEGADKCAAVGGKGVEISFAEEWSGKGSDTFASTERVFDICDRHGARRFRYDSDGIGAHVRGDARVINDRRRRQKLSVIDVDAYRGSEGVLNPEGEDVKGRKNEDYFLNRKAQAWWKMRARCLNTYRWVVDGKPCDPNEIVSINTKTCKNHLKLAAELSQPQYGTNDIGKMLIKKKPDGMKSPNLADAAVIKCAGPGHRIIKVNADMVAKARAARSPSPLLRGILGNLRR